MMTVRRSTRGMVLSVDDGFIVMCDTVGGGVPE